MEQLIKEPKELGMESIGMEAKYQLEYKISGTIAVQSRATDNPFVVLYHVLDWATDHQRDVYGVTIRRNEIPF
jgi:hypothetical protein